MAEKAGVHAKTQQSKQKCSNSCKQNISHSYSGSHADRILQLQRTAGNQAVQRLIKSRTLQAKLRIGQPNDIYEQEADRIAEQVMRMPDVPLHTGGTRVQRKCPKCRDDKGDEKLQAKEISGKTSEVIPHLEAGISLMRGGGQPLPEPVRAFFEPRFGHDFSQVRMHTDAKAAESARAVNSLAYTVGKDVVFGAGQYTPGTIKGNKLLAHELTHVVQQSENTLSGPRIEKPGAQRTSDLLNKQEANPGLSNIVQRKPNPNDEGIEKDVAESVIEAMSQPSSIAGFNVDKAFSILNRYSLPFLLLVLAEVYDQGHLYGLLGYLAPGTKADKKVIVAIRFIQCQKEPSSLAYEEIIEAENFLKRLYDVRLPSKLKSSFDCLERERIRPEKQTGCMSCPLFCGYDEKPLETYNCSGLAFRTYKDHDLLYTKAVLAQRPEVNCGIPCNQVGMIKFWLWEYDAHVEDSIRQGPKTHDFHIVGGPTVGGYSPKDSAQFYSKNGYRRVHGPGTAPSFKPPAREQATSNDKFEKPVEDNNGNPVVYFVRYNIKESCYCFPCPK